MHRADTLTVGDVVIWRGAWGTAAPLLATVTGITQTERPREKYGRDVNTLPWATVRAGYAVVDLNNGSWAYGTQLEPRA